MKILWFTNTPCSAIEKLGMTLNLGGWLSSLENEINKEPEVELAICFYSYQCLEPFNYNGTQFYPVFRQVKKNKVNRLIKRFFPILNDDAREVKELLKVVNEFNPDIIHVHGTEDNFGLLQFYSNISIVISIQGFLNPYSEKYFSGIPFYIASKYEGIIFKLLALGIKRSYKQFKKNAELEKKILKEAKYIIGRTEWDRRIISILSLQSQYFVGNEILRSEFYKNEWNKKRFDNPIQIVSISGDALYKGFETIVSTAQILTKNIDLKFVWKVIGLNNKSKIVRVVKKWKGVNFQSINIQLLGSKNENELIEILLNSDIYCQTSHIENSPNSLCEAMLLGMPIIASYAGGTCSLLKDKEEGLLIQDGDSYSLAGAIIELKSNYPMACKYGNAAKIRSFQRHNSKLVKEEYLKIYKMITERHKREIV